MFEGLIIKVILASLTGLILCAIPVFFYMKGRKAEKQKTIKMGLDYAIKAQKTRAKVASTSNADIRASLRKYTRD